MKIVFASGSVSRNSAGVFEVERRLAQSLYSLSQGTLEIDVVGLEDEYSLEDASAWLPIKTTTFPVTGPAAFAYAPGYLDFFNKSNADAIHLHCLWMYPSVATLQWARAHQKPYMTTINGMLDPWALQNARWKKLVAAALYERKALMNAACIQANTHAEFQAIRDFGLKNPVCLISNGIDLVDRSIQREQPPWSHLVEEGKKILLLLGRVHPKKGHLQLLEAWAKTCREETKLNAEWQLVIVGCKEGGEYESVLLEAARQLDIESSVTFLGPYFGEGMHTCYYHADAFILPSFSEGVPMAALTAWAHELPCLLTPQCNIPEGFSVGAALKIEPDADDIAAGLNVLLTMSDAELAAMGSNGRKLVEEKFSWPKVASQMMEVYLWITANGPRPDCILY